MEATADSTSPTLVRCVVAGQAQAWNRFTEIYAPVVYGWARRTGLQESDAQDVCQNVFVILMKNLPKFRHDQPGHSLRAWMRTITKHALVDWSRKKQKQVGEPAASPETWEQALAKTVDGDGSARQDRNLIVARALEIVRREVEPATWTMFWQFHAEGGAADEIAAAQGVSAWAVYKAKARVLAKLRELLAEFFPLRTA